MKKVIRMISLVLLGIWGIVGMSEAQTTCSAPPSCSALGFDKGAGDCSGQAILRCPFDQSKVFCAGVLPGSGGGEDVCKGTCARVNGTMYRLSELVNGGSTWYYQIDECANLTTDGKHWFPIPSVEVAQAFIGKLDWVTCINVINDAGRYLCTYDKKINSEYDDSNFKCNIYCVTTY